MADHAQPEPPAPLPEGVTRICRDDDCPECGWPETYAECDLSALPLRLDAIGCPKCSWRVEARVRLPEGEIDLGPGATDD